METNGKSLILQRTLGAAVLIAAAATLVPLLLDGDGLKVAREQVKIPDEPTFELQLDTHQQPQVRMLQAKGAIQRAEQEAADAVSSDALGTNSIGNEAAEPTEDSAVTATEGAHPEVADLPTEPTSAGNAQSMEDVIQKITQGEEVTAKVPPNQTAVTATTQPAALGGDVAEAWTIQMGAFKDRSNAEKAVGQLVSRGYRAYLGSQTPGVYRVFVGPEVRRERADQLRARVAAETGTRGVVVRYIP